MSRKPNVSFSRALYNGDKGHTKGGFKFKCEWVYFDSKPNRKFLIAIYPNPLNREIRIMATLDVNGRHLHDSGLDDYGVNLEGF